MKYRSYSAPARSRRHFSLGLAWAALGLQGCAASVRPEGVRIGLMSYSLRDRPFEDAVVAMRQLGFRECELYSPHIEFGGVSAYRKILGLEPAAAGEREALRGQLRAWRHEVPLSHFERAGARCRDAGLAISAYSLAIRDDFDDVEIDRGFQMARALGAPCINASATLSVLPRVAVFAQRHGMRIAVHNHAGMNDENEIETPRSIERALAVSPWIGLNLDIGHCHAAGFDPLQLLDAHRSRITTLHLKDRKADDGPNMPFGEGSTPLRDVLLVMKQKGMRFAANIEYEYRSAEDATVEIARALHYCERVLA